VTEVATAGYNRCESVARLEKTARPFGKSFTLSLADAILTPLIQIFPVGKHWLAGSARKRGAMSLCLRRK
jgi:hypothetical protein